MELTSNSDQLKENVVSKIIYRTVNGGSKIF